MAILVPPLLSAADFARRTKADGPAELVRGELRMMSFAGGRHGVLVGRLTRALEAHVGAHALGFVFSDGVGYHLPIPDEPRDTVRGPDASFVPFGALPDDEIPIGFLRCAPALAVEVLSPHNRPREIGERIADYLAAGTRRLWVVNPETRTITVHAPDAAPVTVGGDADPGAVLDGAPVLPGFALPLAPLFAGLPRQR